MTIIGKRVFLKLNFRDIEVKMPHTCCVTKCGSRSNRDGAEIQFFRVPKVDKRDKRFAELSVSRQNAWLSAIKRSDLQGTKLDNAKVCSIHFISGNYMQLIKELTFQLTFLSQKAAVQTFLIS